MSDMRKRFYDVLSESVNNKKDNAFYQPIYFVTQNVTTFNLAVTSDFNCYLIMFKEILINKFRLFHEYFLLIHYLNAVNIKQLKFNVILGFICI
jgi:hypothetical protein